MSAAVRAHGEEGTSLDKRSEPIFLLTRFRQAKGLSGNYMRPFELTPPKKRREDRGSESPPTHPNFMMRKYMMSTSRRAETRYLSSEIGVSSTKGRDEHGENQSGEMKRFLNDNTYLLPLKCSQNYCRSN